VNAATPAQNPPLRDMRESAFGAILSALVQRCPNVLAAVFFDREGETIDYFSYLDPYSTRLLAAHSGIVFNSAEYRMNWLGGGKLFCTEISTNTHGIVILPVRSEFYLTAIVGREAADGHTIDELLIAVEELATEAGLPSG
jgi:predicted regulator of Ras-like GTPase activity (Roadblock/LC7/MglB family)